MTTNPNSKQCVLSSGDKSLKFRWVIIKVQCKMYHVCCKIRHRITCILRSTCVYLQPSKREDEIRRYEWNTNDTLHIF